MIAAPRSIRFYGLSFVLAAVVLSACDTPRSNFAQRCAASDQPVCAGAPPSFCQLGDCGTVRRTFANLCQAQAAGATSYRPGACEATAGALPQSAAVFPGLRRSTITQSPPTRADLAALYAQSEQDQGLAIAGVAVERRGPSVELLVRGRHPLGCQGVRISQTARIDDSFGVNVAVVGREGCTGAAKGFVERFRLQTGINALKPGVEYEVVVNGKIGRFVY